MTKPSYALAPMSRRALLKTATVAGAATLAAPWILKGARASSGSVNVFAWGDYIKDNMKEAFEKATGITMNLSTYGSNEECENKLRAAGGAGFDLIFPSIDTGPNYYRDDLLQPLDETRFKADQIIPSIYRKSVTLGATHRGKRYLAPFNWGTEALTFDSTKHPDLKFGTLSYGDLWADGLDGRVACRQKSVLVSIVLYLDATGAISAGGGMDLVKDEESARKAFQAAYDFAVAHKKNIGAFWNNATEATAAFTDAGCSIGQTWDTTGVLLHRDVDAKWRYTMPKEGGLGWIDTVGMPRGAANVEQAYALINFLMTPEIGAMMANNTGYNSAAVGAENHLSEANQAAFKMAYPEQAAIDGLWWWPAQTAFFGELRTEFVEKLTNA
ncbi:extracellular solute-binding protein [Pararhodospirillum oryzae]|uniref:Putrescine-binding periplasmic protein n=1 Tax=Pararhodospirillum oryzae TaxID=478448 RepID=A0A512H563_9PROT|nr:extracellular solute-binding protein [Pararhodospirillum oryzae]GEO80612.1 putrescine-binding periplasmic protein [Pararhodospirillum oryzae]